MENNQVNTAGVSAAEKDYQDSFMPKVHVIGRSTMVLAFILAFLPVIYFNFVKGYTLPFASYVNTMVVIGSIGIGMWLTEPLAYWPVLGSAGTYMAYLSGNVGGMRFPVALTVQSATGADINTPRGQVVTIVGIFASIITNLVILLAIVIGGEWILSILPKVVLASFGFVMPALMGSMTVMRFASNKGGFFAGLIDNLPYLATAMICKFLISKVFTQFATFGTAISVGVTILVAFIMYKARVSKAAK